MSTAETPLKPECREFEAAVQAWLDGTDEPISALLDRHRLSCSHCRQFHLSALTFRRLLALQPAVALPAGLTERLTQAVLADVRPSPSVSGRRWQRRSLWWVVAACAFVGVALLRPWSPDGWLRTQFTSPAPTPPNIVHGPEGVKPLALGEQWAEASAALATLTRRTADQAVEPTRKLFNEPFDPPTLPMTGTLPQSLEPAAQSLDEVRSGAAASFEPMTRSARRAFSMLLGEVSAEPKTKTDS